MDTNNKDKGLTKAQQFLRDVGLFTDKAEKPVDVPSLAVADNILYFLSDRTTTMHVASQALPIHINNLINRYGLDIVKDAFSREIMAIEHENGE